MSNIATYSGNFIHGNTFAGESSKIVQIVNWLHNNLETVEKEFDDLEKKQENKPNRIFPLKMQALSQLYQSVQVLYKWYVERTGPEN